jgi:branched-chain amino acid transport system substrate-binding protein
MTNGFMLAGGQLKYNYISHYKKEEFSIDTLASFIKDNPEVKKIVNVFSGDMARLFFEKLGPLQKENKLQCYASPMMLDGTPGDFAEPRPVVPDMCGFTHWVPELDNETNQAFLQFYKTEQGKDPNLFGMHGWENALLLMKYLELRKEVANTETVIEHLMGNKMNSPRGTVSLNGQRHIIGPAHFAEASGRLQVIIKKTITDLQETWDEMCAQIPKEEGSSWRNTYLCI